MTKDAFKEFLISTERRYDAMINDPCKLDQCVGEQLAKDREEVRVYLRAEV